MEFCYSEVDITPDFEVALAGYAGLDRRTDVAASPLMVKVVLLRQQQLCIAIVTVDSLYVGQTFHKRLTDLLSERSGHTISSQHVVIVPSHTHLAPTLDDRLFDVNPFDTMYGSWVNDRINSLFANGCEWSSGSLFMRTLDLPGFTVHRRRKFKAGLTSKVEIASTPNPLGHSANAAASLMIKNADDQAEIVLWNFACHPTLSDNMELISSHFAGAVAQSQPELKVMFCQGFSGDISPLLDPQQIGFKEKLRARALRLPAKAQTGKNYQNWLQAMVRKFGLEIRKTWTEVKVKLDSYMVEDTMQTLGINTKQNLVLRVLSLGSDCKLYSINAEPSFAYQQILQRHDPGAFFLCGCGPGITGYLPTNDQVREGGYEACDFIPLFGHSGGYRTDVEQIFQRRWLKTALS